MNSLSINVYLLILFIERTKILSIMLKYLSLRFKIQNVIPSNVTCHVY